MQTAVTKRGQTVIPAPIRRRHRIVGGARLVWLDDGETIHVIPTPADPIASLRGRGRGEKLVDHLLTDRRLDGAREDRS